MGMFVMPKVHEYTTHPFGGGTLTLDGVQYSNIYNSSVASNFTPTNGGAFNIIDMTYPGGRGVFRELEVGLSAEFQANATTLMQYRWEGRNLAPLAAAWASLTANIEANVTTGWTANLGTYSGRIAPVAGFNSVPFEIRLQFKTNHADMGLARIKNSSYVRALYQAN